MKTTKTLAWAIVDKKGKIAYDDWNDVLCIYKKKATAKDFREGSEEKVVRVEIKEVK